MEEFSRIQRLPPYVFAVVGDLKMKLRRQNIDIVDFSMGNPDIHTPPHIVDKLVEAAQKPVNHRYSLSRGIPHLRDAVCERYKRLYDVDLDPNTEAIVTMGSKEGLAHLSLAMLSPGDVVLAPDPTYPIHKYAPIIAGADVRSVPIGPGRDFFEDLTAATKQAWPRPKLLFLCYPHNPTTEVTDLAFFEKVVEFAKENNIWVIHDLAYADLVFDGYKAPSFLQAKGAKDVGVEFYTMSKSYSMPGWRVGFCLGNPKLIHALSRIKSYLDYGIFQPIQIDDGAFADVQQKIRVDLQRGTNRPDVNQMRLGQARLPVFDGGKTDAAVSCQLCLRHPVLRAQKGDFIRDHGNTSTHSIPHYVGNSVSTCWPTSWTFGASSGKRRDSSLNDARGEKKQHTGKASFRFGNGRNRQSSDALNGGVPPSF